MLFGSFFMCCDGGYYYAFPIGKFTLSLPKCESVILKTLISFYQQKVVVIHREVSLIVKKIIDRAFLCRVDAGEEIEVKTLCQQLVAGGAGLVLVVEFTQNAVILAQPVVDIAHEGSRIAILPIVRHIAAIVATELFI